MADIKELDHQYQNLKRPKFMEQKKISQPLGMSGEGSPMSQGSGPINFDPETQRQRFFSEYQGKSTHLKNYLEQTGYVAPGPKDISSILDVNQTSFLSKTNTNTALLGGIGSGDKQNQYEKLLPNKNSRLNRYASKEDNLDNFKGYDSLGSQRQSQERLGTEIGTMKNSTQRILHASHSSL